MSHFLLANLNISVLEIIILQAGAVIVGIVIHFFIVSRRHLNNEMRHLKKSSSGQPDEWKLKYLNDIEVKDKLIGDAKAALQDAQEHNKIYEVEISELRSQVKRLQTELQLAPKAGQQNEQLQEALRANRLYETETDELNQLVKRLQAELQAARQSGTTAAVTVKRDYMEELKEAKQSLQQHNEKISQLLEQIDIVKETEEKQQEMLRSNEILNSQISDLKYLLAEKESEIKKIRQKENITKEMSAMLDGAYAEFDVLQAKIRKLEEQASNNRMLNIDYEDLKEAYYKLNNEHDALKTRYQATAAENQQLHGLLDDTEDKLRESNFQKQQLQKRITYLEELTNDLQVMSDANKKLEHQIKKIGELESRLNMLAEERDQLKEQQSRQSGS